MIEAGGWIISSTIRARGDENFPVEDMIAICAMNIRCMKRCATVSPAEAAMRAAGVLYNIDEFVAKFFERGAIKATLVDRQGQPAQSRDGSHQSLVETVFSGRGQRLWRRGAQRRGHCAGRGGRRHRRAIQHGADREKRNDMAITMGVPQSMLFADAANHATSQDRMSRTFTIQHDCAGLRSDLRAAQ
jgi:hypothetical protein